MELTKCQNEGLKIAIQRYKNREKYTVISGYAGTGKSTLVKFIIEALNVPKDKVGFACFTGKAAEVLRKKGNKNAITLHKMLYDFFVTERGTFIKRPKKELDYKVIVVDECSMTPKSMIDLLLSYENIYVLFIGDPFQIHSINSNESHNLLDHPHIFLEEIMRQAAESEIIQLTMKIRENKEIPLMRGKEVQVLSKKELNTGMLTWADQILVATNTTRNYINNQVRELKGFYGLPQEGEKMICLRNYWDILNRNGDAIVNGMTGIIKNPIEGFKVIPRFIQKENRYIYNITCDFIPDGMTEEKDNIIFKSLELDRKMILTGEKSIDWQTAYKLNKIKEKYGEIIPLEFAFGYAITGHKAQGSEWDKVLVIEEKFPYDKIEHSRWLYTCCTRSASRLVLIRK